MDDLDCRILSTISERGYDVIFVGAETDEVPAFCYSVGLRATTGQPDVVVIGLRAEMAIFVVNEYCLRVKVGERFEPGGRYLGFLNEFPVSFERVDAVHYHSYLRFNSWGYAGTEANALQLVYPNTSGVWPWDAEADEWFRRYQRLLTTDGRPVANESA